MCAVLIVRVAIKQEMVCPVKFELQSVRCVSPNQHPPTNTKQPCMQQKERDVSQCAAPSSMLLHAPPRQLDTWNNTRHLVICGSNHTPLGGCAPATVPPTRVMKEALMSRGSDHCTVLL